MGNQNQLPERTFDALNFLALTDADFRKADKDRNGKLSATELLKLLRTKENEMRRHANTLKRMTMKDCQKLCDAKLSDQRKFVNVVAAEAERRRQVKSNGRKPRVQHPHSRMIQRNNLMRNQLGVSAGESKGLSEAKIRGMNQARVAAATRREQKILTEQYKGINKHFRHQTTVALHDHWMKNCGLSTAEQAKLGNNSDKVRTANQSRALKGMEAQRKEYLHAQALDDASEKRQRHENTRKAITMAERERVRRVLENKRHRKKSNQTRRAQQAKAAAAMDHEQARRMHEHNQAAAHSEMARRQNQKQAAAMRDGHQARLVHEAASNEVHADMKRRNNQRKVAGDRDHEQARHSQKWKWHDAHHHLARKKNQTAAAAARAEERKRLMAQNKTSGAIKKSTGEHPHSKIMKYHKMTHHETPHFD